MASTGTQLAPQRTEGQQPSLSVRLDTKTLAFVLSVLLQLLSLAVAYGKFVDANETVKVELQEIRTDIHELRSVVMHGK